VDDQGKVHILNPTDIKVYNEYPTGRCDEAMDEGWDETGDEGWDETGDRHKSELKSSHESLPKSELLPNDASKLVSEQATDSLRSSSLAENQEAVAVSPLADKVGCSQTLPRLFGLDYFTSNHVADMERIATVLNQRNRSVVWLEQLTVWAKTGWWKKRLHSGNKALGQLAGYLETGAIAEQFDSHLALEAKNRDPFRPIPGGNPLLNRDHMAEHMALHPETRLQSEGIGRNAWDAYADALNSEPGSMEQQMKLNRAKVAAVATQTFDPEEA
jgi:hypothetical protein